MDELSVTEAEIDEAVTLLLSEGFAPNGIRDSAIHLLRMKQAALLMRSMGVGLEPHHWQQAARTMKEFGITLELQGPVSRQPSM